MEKIKSLKDELEFQMDCSFRPEISEKARMLKKYDEDIDNKLYLDAFDRIDQKEKLRLMKDQEEVGKLTFQPQISKASVSILDRRVPLESRHKEIQKFKNQMILKLREKFKVDQELTFQPKISKISNKVASIKNNGTEVVKRLLDKGEELERKKLELAYRENLKKAQECSFHPNVNFEGNYEVSFLIIQKFNSSS